MVSRQQLKKEATKDLILKTASDLFSSKGFEQTTVNDIVEAANLAKGTFYYHFESKEDLIIELENEEFRTMAEQFKEEINLSPIKSIEKLLDMMAEWSEKKPDNLKMHLTQRLNFNRINKKGHQPSPLTDLLVYVFSMAKQENLIITDTTPMELAHMFGMMLVQAQLYWLAFPEQYPLKQGFKKCLKVFLHGALKERKNEK